MRSANSPFSAILKAKQTTTATKKKKKEGKGKNY